MADERSPGTVVVTGVGTVNARPDMATVSGGVVTEDETAGAALAKNNEAMAKILETYKSAGVAEEDLSTSGFSIHPKYVYPKRTGNENKPPQIVGYTVNNRVTAKIRDLESLGRVLDAIVTAGANAVDSVSFRLADSTVVLDEARAKAAEDARRKAEIYAGSLGVTLGRIILISESTSVPRPRPIARAAMAAEASAAAEVPIAAGSHPYRANVNVTWEIQDGQ